MKRFCREMEMRTQQETKEQPVKKKTRRQRNQRRTSATESGLRTVPSRSNAIPYILV